MDRRSLILAAVAGSTPALFGSAARAEAAALPGADLDALLAEVLQSELEDDPTVNLMVEWIRQVALTWHPDAEPYEFADYIIAFAFGNRPPANGGDPATTLAEPGPTNEALADVIAAMLRTKRVPVYAQWEIARILESKHHINDVISIEPVIEEDGTIVYLSTDDVAKRVAELRADRPGGPGRASVVGFRDHHKRCVLTCRANDLIAHAPEGVAMPSDYDSESGQVWTRYRPVYLATDMAGQLALLQGELLEAAGEAQPARIET